MCTVVHLEPEDFARELVHNQKKCLCQNVCPRLWTCRSYLYVPRFTVLVLPRQTGLFEGKKGYVEIYGFL